MVLLYWAHYNDSIWNVAVFDPADSTKPLYNRNRTAEIDSYKGSITFAATATPAVINIPMKRTAFGVKLNVTNFTGGKLWVDYANEMAAKILTPQEAATQSFIYSSDDFRFRDSMFNRLATVTLQWQKPNGDFVARRGFPGPRC